jgi:4a-hydroxytetrahydrobiopterin dehydratase
MDIWQEKDKFLEKEFVFEDFKEAVGFVNKVAVVAEELGHHPDIFVYDYKKVRLTTTTHDAGKITDKDYELADRIDRIG